MVERPDGAIEYLAANPTIRDGAVRRTTMAPRWPARDGTEEWDFTTGGFVIVADRALSAIDRKHGSDAIRIAHAMKAVEARLLLAGVEVPGSLIAREAAATGQSPSALAAAIVANAEQDDQSEVERIMAKRDVREANGA